MPRVRGCQRNGRPQRVNVSIPEVRGALLLITGILSTSQHRKPIRSRKLQDERMLGMVPVSCDCQDFLYRYKNESCAVFLQVRKGSGGIQRTKKGRQKETSGQKERWGNNRPPPKSSRQKIYGVHLSRCIHGPPTPPPHFLINTNKTVFTSAAPRNLHLNELSSSS